MKTGQIQINGPMTPEEKKELDEFRFMKANYERNLADLEKALEETDDPENRALMEQDPKLTKNTLKKLKLLVPDEELDLVWIKKALKK